MWRILAVQLQDIKQVGSAPGGFLNFTQHGFTAPQVLVLPAIGQLGNFLHDIPHAGRGQNLAKYGVYHPGVELRGADAAVAAAGTFLCLAAVVVVVELGAAGGGFCLHGGAALAAPQDAGEHKLAVRARARCGGPDPR
ncbi:hypothetical protein ABNW52_05830 [Vogesella sp. MAHUQ-64]|uniref:Uncharacterized protein n=1 Tax=Vogesella oryzagri TaxID=3160864 RepID=A0ABV1M1S3_9NEIS